MMKWIGTGLTVCLCCLLICAVPVAAGSGSEGSTNVKMILHGVNLVADSTVAEWGYAVSPKTAEIHHESQYSVLVSENASVTILVNLQPGYLLDVTSDHPEKISVAGGKVTVSKVSGAVSLSLKAKGGYTVRLDNYVYGQAPASSVGPTIEPAVPAGSTVNYYYSFSVAGDGKKWTREAGNKLDALVATDSPYYIYAKINDGSSEIETARSVFRVLKAPGIVPGITSIDVSNMPVVVSLNPQDVGRNLEYSVDGGRTWVSISQKESNAGLFSIPGLLENTEYTLMLRACETRNYLISDSRVQEFTTPDLTPIYRVTYNANGGLDSPDAMSAKEGASIEIDAGQTVWRLGYAFAGWWTKSDGGEHISGSITVTKNMVLYAHWVHVPYDITFNANGGSGSKDPITGVYIDDESVSLGPCTFTAPSAEVSFIGWSRVQGGNVIYADNYIGTPPLPDANNPNELELYAVWSPTNTYEIIGNVSGVPGKRVNIKLMYGNIVVKSIDDVQLDTEGRYSYRFSVSNGVYDIVVETVEKDITVTRLVVIQGSSKEIETIYLPDSGANSFVEVKPNTPQTVVGKLDTEAEEHREAGKSITLLLVVEQEIEEVLPSDRALTQREREIQTAIADIKRAAGEDAGDMVFISVDITKIIKSAGVTTRQTVTATDTVLELVIPYEYGNKENFQIFRKHADSVDKMQRIYSRGGSDGTYYYDETNKLVYLYSQKFSLYSFSYDVYKPNVDVLYDSNGGTGSMDKETVKLGNSVILKQCQFTPPKGKEFDCWNVDGVAKYPGDTLTPGSSVNVVAQWKDVRCWTVSFDANGGSGSMTPITVRVGESVQVPQCSFEAPVGKTFDCWLLDGEKLYPGDTLTPTADIVLVAQWRSTGGGGGSGGGSQILPAGMYTVTFDSGGGTPVATQMVTPGSLVREPAVPEKFGCVFVGWYTEDGYRWNFAADPVLSDMTLYALWDADTCVVTFDTLGKTVNPPKQILSAGSTVVQPATVTAPWLIFPSWWVLTGWTDASTGLSWDFASDVVTSDMVLNAQWLFPWWWIVIAVLIIAGLVILLVWMKRKPKKQIITQDEDGKEQK